MIFISLCWSKFSSYIILLAEEFPLVVLVVQVCWQWISLNFVCLKKSISLSFLKGFFHWVKNSVICIFLSVCYRCHCRLLACVVSDKHSLFSLDIYSLPFFKNLWKIKLFSFTCFNSGCPFLSWSPNVEQFMVSHVSRMTLSFFGIILLVILKSALWCAQQVIIL